MGEGDEGKGLSVFPEVADTGELFASIMLVETTLMSPLPFRNANEIVAIGPLAEKAFVLMMAIVIEPGRVVFAASIAPATREPCVTVGVASAAES
ncbi:MAG: hypothetical protein A2076_16850 [Geobacteraceae bacterium GWC2_53_11]|nr:MAG: hypothetical protein A2076_16850 [Geobacteraceae bacterium GWC2_53_11]